MSCNLSSTGLNGSELIYLDSNYNTLIPTSNEILFPINDITYVKIDSSGLNVYNSTGNLMGWWNVKDKIKTLISLIYLDALNDTVIASSNEIKFDFDNDILVKINEFGLFVFENDEWWNVKDKIKTLISLIYLDSDDYTNVSSLSEIHFTIGDDFKVKIDSTGLNIYSGSQWWNLKDKIQEILNKWADLDARHIVFETQLLALKGEMYAAQVQIGIHSASLLANGLTLTGHSNSIIGINNSISDIDTEINEIKSSINNLINVNTLNVSQTSVLNGDTTLLSSLYVSGFTTLNDTSIYSNLNVSGFTTLNNTTFISSLYVSGFATLNNVSIYSNLNVSGFTTLNNTTIISNLNVSGFTTLNNTTIISS
jgi:hypothetical protein